MIGEFLASKFTPEQLSTLKTLGLVSLIGGTSAPLIKEMFKNIKARVIKPVEPASSTSMGTVELPIPDYENDIKGLDTSKRVYKFKPGKKLEVKRANLSDLTNPYFIPGVVAAGAVPGILGFHLASKLIKGKNVAEKEEEAEKAKEDFSKALIEAHSNRLGHPIVVGRKPTAVDEFVSNLNELAKSNLEKAKAGLGKAKETISNLTRKSVKAAETCENKNESVKKADLGDWNPMIPVARYIMPAIDTVTESLKDLPRKATEGAKGYAGLLGGLGLAGLGLGTMYGFKKQKAEDKETADSYRYLAEFLRRQQEQGMPVYVTPSSVGYSAPKTK